MEEVRADLTEAIVPPTLADFEFAAILAYDVVSAVTLAILDTVIVSMFLRGSRRQLEKHRDIRPTYLAIPVLEER